MLSNNIEYDLKSLTELFIESFRLFHQLVLYESDNSDDKIITAMRILELTIRRVDHASLFSKNEDFDDYANDSLKYLFLSYFLGKIASKYMHIKDRKTYLITAKTSLSQYIELCKKFNIINEDDKMFIDTNNNPNNMNDNTRRTMKIAKFKREKEAKESMKALLLKMNIEAKKVPDYESIEALDDDDDTKQLLLLQFQSYVRDAIDEIVLINQEIDLLDHMSELKELEDEFGSKQIGQMPPPSSSSIEINSEIGKANISYLPSRDYPDHRDEKGLDITKLNKVDDQLVMTRDTIKANVFIPSMAPPTISLEEFADMEKEKALARSANESNESNITRRYNQLVNDGDEDDAKLVDLATMEDRDWDSFKEANPRGWGNKMGKRF